MLNQEQPPNASGGPLESPDNKTPEGLLVALYQITVGVSADFLKALEEMAFQFGADRKEFDHAVFWRGVESIALEINKRDDDDFQAEMFMLGRLGAMSRGDKESLW